MRTISYGGMLKKVSRKAAVQGFAPETAVDFARIINECETGFGAARGYAFISVSRTEKEALKKMLAPMPGMKQCCEFQFSFKDEQGVEIGQPRDSFDTDTAVIQLTNTKSVTFEKDLLNGESFAQNVHLSISEFCIIYNRPFVQTNFSGLHLVFSLEGLGIPESPIFPQLKWRFPR